MPAALASVMRQAASFVLPGATNIGIEFMAEGNKGDIFKRKLETGIKKLNLINILVF